jgi:hypothetical protein
MLLGMFLDSHGHHAEHPVILSANNHYNNLTNRHINEVFSHPELIRSKPGAIVLITITKVN